jgi:hypothetical protein
MRRALIGPDSIASMAIKPLLILALAFVALFVAPAVTSAAPAGGAQVDEVAVVASDWSASTTGVKAVSNSDAAINGINAVYDCRYFSRFPFSVVDFTCRVTAGAIQVFVNCVDGRTVSSSVLPAVGTYNFSLSCGAARISTFRVQEIL